MTCEQCVDPDGVPCLPQYGRAPHVHLPHPSFPSIIQAVPLPREEWPPEFEEDQGNLGYGVWYCTNCGER
jgi:hypothetical protein